MKEYKYLPQPIKCGNVIGELTVLDHASYPYEFINKRGRRNKLWYRKCLCSCGKITYAKNSALIQNKRKSCGCINPTRPTAEVALPRLRICLVNNWRDRAKRRKLGWSLTEDEAIKLSSGNCFYCGVVPSSKFTHHTKHIILYSGIDRLNNRIGYVLYNCVSCCKTCNFAKHILSKDEFLLKIKMIYENLDLQNLSKLKEVA